MALPSRNIGGEFVGKVPIAVLLSKLDAGAPTMDGFFEVGCGFTQKRKPKRSQWGSILRKALQKWMKMAIWQIEFGLRCWSSSP
jgi:hypothetical protein